MTDTSGSLSLVLLAIGVSFFVTLSLFWAIYRSLTSGKFSSSVEKNLDEAKAGLEASLGQTRMELSQQLSLSSGLLENRLQGFETQINQKMESLSKTVEGHLTQNLKEGFRQFEKVNQTLTAAEVRLAELKTVGQSIHDLHTLLKLPHLRGGFGEASLERLLADFLPSYQYSMQHKISDESTERVDAAVKLHDQWLPIDSKFPREQVLPLFESADPQAIEAARKALSETLKIQAKSIAQKYIRPDLGTTEMALLFLPSELLYFEVVRNGKLYEALVALKVFPVSPNTLAITLKSVSVAETYYRMAQGVEKTIEDLQKSKRHLELFETRFEEIGKQLARSQEAFATAQTHLGRYHSSIGKLSSATNVQNGEPIQGHLPQVTV